MAPPRRKHEPERQERRVSTAIAITAILGSLFTLLVLTIAGWQYHERFDSGLAFALVSIVGLAAGVKLPDFSKRK